MFATRPRPARISGLLVTAIAVSAGLATSVPASAVTGPEVAVGQVPALARLNIGDEANSRACTGVLVDQNWIATAASCFAATPGTPVPAGKPALKATATLGDGSTVEITEIAPRDDRDVALVRLATPVAAVKSVSLATAAPAAGAELTAAGFGRTKGEWVPDKAHTGTFTVGSGSATTLAVKGKGTDAICKGDTGGPLLNSAGELVGINSRSWQGGCLGARAAETRTDAIGARTDDLAGWIRDTVRPGVQRDVNGDGRSDALMTYYHGDSRIGFYSALAKPDGGFDEFTAGYTVPANSWDRNAMKLVTGDFNGDRRTDMAMMYRFNDGTIKMYTGLADTTGHIQPFTSSYTVPANAGWDWNSIELKAGDANGDGRSDALMTYYHGDSRIGFYTALAKPDGGFDEFTAGYTVPANSWDRNAMKLVTGDFNGDRRTDMAMMYRFNDGTIKMYTGLADT
ncbi:trypsin-like serine protease, partial [Streptomyces lavendulae]|uniref:trypsin-like serine protease n=1 Tax=Streptomyces lavendulae TaxID=1914 RepID=UPI0038249CDB